MGYDFASLLNERQLDAVATKSQYDRIIAGAGSGKTRVLTYRLAYLVSEMNVDPKRILAIAFTNKVAKEMKERASSIIPSLSSFIRISTFHSFCAYFLRIEHDAIGYPVSFSILDEDDSKKLIQQVSVELGNKKTDEVTKSAYNFINVSKTKGLYPDDVRPDIRTRSEDFEKLVNIYRLYEQRKAETYSLDFDDLLLQCIAVLENYPDLREKWSNRYDHILVDEFQDTNNVQFHLMNLLSRKDTNVYVVGDPDQTIYTWRGANQEIIIHFEQHYHDPETIILDRNYRSTKKILGAANKLIANNKNRVPKDLYTKEREGEDIVANKSYSSEAEAKWLTNRVMTLLNQGVSYKDIAVLYRSSYVTRSFEQSFAANGIPYRIFGGLRFYQRLEVKDVLAYFRLLVNPKDDVAFERIVNTPRRGIGETTVIKIREEASEHGKSMYEHMKDIASTASTRIPTKAINALTVMIAKMESTKSRLNENLEAYSQVLKDLIQDLGYYEYIRDMEEIDEDRVGNVNALFDDISHFISNNPTSTFEEYLQNVSLLSSQDDMNNGDYISLMTIHVAKGLEFDNVFVVSMNEGTFPSQRSILESANKGLEEERRLAYVALTRAKKRLYLSCNSGYSYQTDSKAAPSCFFKEAGVAFSVSEVYQGSGRPFFSSSSFGYRKTFDDGDHYDPFQESKKPEREPLPEKKDNGIVWKVGDIAHHEKWGDGKVIDIVNSTIIKVDFISQGVKTLLGSHPMLSKKSGGLA